MLENLDDYIVGIAIGVRFQPHFSIEDNFGSLVDKILNKKNAYFNRTMFPQVGSSPIERALINPNNNNYLRINTSNIILAIQFGNDIKITDISTINDRFHKDIINDIMLESSIAQIIRVGYIRKYLFHIEALSRVFINKTIGETLQGVNDINLQFSKKIPVSEAYAKKGVSDYNNVIFNIIKKADKEEIYMSVDYQKCFIPFLDNVNQMYFVDFLKNVEHYNTVSYAKWLDAYYEQAK